MSKPGLKMRMRVTGGREIPRKLEQIPKDIAAGPMQEAVIAGAEIIQAEAIRAAERIRKTGVLASDINVELGVETIGTNVEAKIGPGKAGWYGRLVEFGHKNVRVTGRVKKGRRTYRITESLGETPPHPWLRPALDAKREDANKAMIRILERRLGHLWRK